ncbi:MAG: hypothetical protein KJ749_04775 [Planctomycetes bacterium]|nr:hypothetical protein [Planctomycetota bacterium]
MNKKTLMDAAVFVVLVGLCLAGRLVPHAANLAPVLAVALFAGFYFQRKAVAILVPLASLAISDAVIGGYDVRMMIVVYLAFMFPLVYRRFLRAKLAPLRVGVCALSASAVFFVSTNFAVWAWGGWYAPTAEGLIQCYAAALPFLRNTACGDLLWSAVLFGGYVLAIRLSRAPEFAGQPSTRTSA